MVSSRNSEENTVKGLPHYALPLLRDEAQPELKERALQVQAMKAQKTREQLLMVQMERLADTLCQQYLHAAIISAAHNTGTTPNGAVAIPTSKVIGQQETPLSSSFPLVLPKTPDRIPVDEIRRQVAQMQFHINAAVLSGGAHHTIDDKALQGTTQQLLAPARAQQALIPQPPAQNETNATARRNRAAPVLQTQRLIPSSEARRIRTQFGHSEALSGKTVGQVEAGGAADMFDLPTTSSPRHTQSNNALTSTLGKVSFSKYEEMFGATSDSSVFAPLKPTTNSVPGELVALNPHASKMYETEEHGLLVGHVQPLLDSMPTDHFRYLDCVLDGNSTCLSMRNVPKLNKVDVAMRCCPAVAPPPDSPSSSRVRKEIIGTIPPGGFALAEKKREFVRRQTEAAAYSKRGDTTGEWSPRDKLSRAAETRTLRIG